MEDKSKNIYWINAVKAIDVHPLSWTKNFREWVTKLKHLKNGLK